MIIGHCIHGLGLGGAQQVIAAIARGRSPDLQHVVYSCEDGVLADPVREAGATVRIVPRRIPKFDPFWIRGLATWMERDRVEVVHTHLFGDTLHGLLAARRLGLPVLATLHSVPESFSAVQRAGYRWLLPRAERVIACSDSVFEAFAVAEPELKERLVSIPNGVDIPLGEYTEETRAEARRALGLAEADVVLGCIGRLHPQKAFDRVIDALAEADQVAGDGAAPRASLLIIGDGPLRQDLESQAARLGLANRVVFAGARSDVGALLPLLDAIVFASPYEGLPMALLEAMSAGLCVVGADIEAFRDVLVSGEEALLLSEDAWAEGLDRVIRDEALRRRLGQGGKEKHRKAFSGQKMVSAYEGLYRETLASVPV